MSYVALYRKFRPSTFEEVKGQDHIVTTLRNQIRSDRIGHAYCFCGTRGTGKTSVAKVFAKAVNCLNPQNGSPCNECEMCRRINAGNSLNVIEIDAASNNGVDNIRQIVEEVTYRPAEGRFRVYIIDEVHMLSGGAFNALLKTLEEPPEYVIFILATTEVHKIPVTILSRCQRYDFHRIGTDVITDRLIELTEKEGIDADPKGLQYIARSAEGAMRDALSLLDQCASFLIGEKLTYEKILNVLGAADSSVFQSLLAGILAGDTASVIGQFEDLIAGGRDAVQFVNDFTWYLRNVLIVKTASENAEELIDMPAEQIREMASFAENVSADLIVRYIRELSELSGALRQAANARIRIEVCLIRLSRNEFAPETGGNMPGGSTLTPGTGGENAIAPHEFYELSDRLYQSEMALKTMTSRMQELEMQLGGAIMGNGMPGYPQGMDPNGGYQQGVGPNGFPQGVGPNGGFPQGMSGYPQGVNGFQQGMPGYPQGMNGGFSPVQAPPPAPEELQIVCRNWKEITGQVREGFAKQLIAAASPEFDPNETEPVLYVVFSSPLAERIIEKQEIMREMEWIISRKYKIRVPVRFRMKESGPSSLSAIPVGEVIRSRIHMEIEEEE